MRRVVEGDAPLYKATNRFTNPDEEEVYQEYFVERNLSRARRAVFVASGLFLAVRAATWLVYAESPWHHGHPNLLIPDLGWVFGFLCGFVLLMPGLRAYFQALIAVGLVLFGVAFGFSSFEEQHCAEQFSTPAWKQAREGMSARMWQTVVAGHCGVVGGSNVLLGFVVLATALPMVFRLDFLHCGWVGTAHVLIYIATLFVGGSIGGAQHMAHVVVARLLCYVLAVAIAIMGAHRIDRYQRQQFLFCHYYGQTAKLLSYDGVANEADAEGDGAASGMVGDAGDGAAWELPDLG